MASPVQRLDVSTLSAPAYRTLVALDSRAAEGPLPARLLDLVRLRVSQLNGCAYCVDSHTTDALAGGEPTSRVAAVAAWAEGPWFDERERAAFALAESMTKLTDGDRVPASLWQHVSKHFDPQELSQLVMVITVINAWNRLGVALRMVPESYPAAGGRAPQPAQRPA
jgi:AhpD family alkylhydroperoxidase